jgi:hypothetical protein
MGGFDRLGCGGGTRVVSAGISEGVVMTGAGRQGLQQEGWLAGAGVGEDDDDRAGGAVATVLLHM